MNKENALSHHSLPVGSAGKLSTGWWGIWALIVTEGALFGYLLFVYFYLMLQTDEQWPPEGKPSLIMPAINTAILLVSSAFVWASEYCIRLRQTRWSIGIMTLAIIFGICFVLIQLMEWSNTPYGITSNLYGSLYFMITGFHLCHVIVGIVILSLLLMWITLGYFDDKRHTAVTIGGVYWHFVDAVWLFVFVTLYLFPYL